MDYPAKWCGLRSMEIPIVVLGCPIGPEVKAKCRIQPEEYKPYFEDWIFHFNAEIRPKGIF